MFTMAKPFHGSCSRREVAVRPNTAIHAQDGEEKLGTTFRTSGEGAPARSARGGRRQAHPSRVPGPGLC
jgi:hypothetical protein